MQWENNREYDNMTDFIVKKKMFSSLIPGYSGSLNNSLRKLD